MNAYRKLLMAIVIVGGVGGSLTASSVDAATYSWINPQGGAWDDSSNWDRSGYPSALWDVALFNLEGSYEVTAMDASRAAGVGITFVSAGDVILRTHDDFRTVVSVGATARASLTLREGTIVSGSQHIIGSLGTVVLEPGTGMLSTAAGEVGFAIDPGGLLCGDGAALENRVVRSSGTVSPGLAARTAGVLVFGRNMPGGFVQRATGSLEIDLGGSTPGQSHDQVRVEDSGSAVTLDGELVVSLIDGHVPGADEEYDIIVAPAIVGTFAEAVLPTLPGVEFSLVYESDRVKVVARGEGEPTLHALDIQPGTCWNPLNRLRRGVIPAALLGSADLDVRDINFSSLQIEGIAPKRSSFDDIAAPPSSEPCACPDPNADGREDLLLKFPADELMAAIVPLLEDGEGIVTITGTLVSGEPFEAQDCVSLRPRGHASGPPRRGGDHFDRRHARLQISPASAPSAIMQRVTYTLPEAGSVRLEVFSVTGRKVADVVRDVQALGEHSIEWSTGSIPNGIYVYRLAAGGQASTAKLVLLR